MIWIIEVRNVYLYTMENRKLLKKKKNKFLDFFKYNAHNLLALVVDFHYYTQHHIKNENIILRYFSQT